MKKRVFLQPILGKSHVGLLEHYILTLKKIKTKFLRFQLRKNRKQFLEKEFFYVNFAVQKNCTYKNTAMRMSIKDF